MQQVGSRSEDHVLGLSLKAGGVGLNLVPGVTAMVMLSQSFSPADTRQVEKRIHRCGQTSEAAAPHPHTRKWPAPEMARDGPR